MLPIFLLFVLTSWVPVLLFYVGLLSLLDLLIRRTRQLLPRSNVVRQLETEAAEATNYESWAAASSALDARNSPAQAWKHERASSVYRWEGIARRVEDLSKLIAASEVDELSWRMGQFPVRHYCNITDPRLYARLRIGTKELIEQFVKVHISAAKLVAGFPSGTSAYLTDIVKLNAFRAPRVAIGRTALILQAGNVFGICHIGVVKELLLRDLLPRVVIGNGSGAFAACLVVTFSDRELGQLLSGNGLKLSSFFTTIGKTSKWGLFCRFVHLLKTGHSMDHDALAECLEANIGDITFEEAFYRTGKILNITLSCDTNLSTPNVLNYITAPTVVIRTAASASCETDPVKAVHLIRTKDDIGALHPWNLARDVADRPKLVRGPKQCVVDTTPALARVRELFNVNHFVISQARPYLASLLIPSFRRPHYPQRVDETWTESAVRMLTKEVKHRIRQARTLGIAPAWATRLLDDELIEEASIRRQRREADSFDSITVIPELSVSDLERIVHDPSPTEIDRLILRGQRSVWSAVSALEVRCRIEIAFDRYYQMLKKNNPLDGEGTPVVMPKSSQLQDPIEGLESFDLSSPDEERRSSRSRMRRRRSQSLGGT